jgi:hypothetical protein
MRHPVSHGNVGNQVLRSIINAHNKAVSQASSGVQTAKLLLALQASGLAGRRPCSGVNKGVYTSSMIASSNKYGAPAACACAHEHAARIDRLRLWGHALLLVLVLLQLLQLCMPR